MYIYIYIYTYAQTYIYIYIHVHIWWSLADSSPVDAPPKVGVAGGMQVLEPANADMVTEEPNQGGHFGYLVQDVCTQKLG